MKSIEKIIKSVIRFLLQSSLFKSLSKYAASDTGQKNIVLPIEMDSTPEMITVEHTEPLLASEPPIILVKCVSCGTVHELTAVCQNCKKPVCSDIFCQKEVYMDDFELSVIQCRNCVLNP